MARSSALIGVSLLVHASIAAGVSSIRQERRREATSITMAETRKKAEPPKPVDPPKPADLPEPPRNTPAPRQPAKRAAPTPAQAPAEAPKATNAAAAMDALPDFGLSLSGGVGVGGIAVAAATPGAAPVATSQGPRPQAFKVAPKPNDDGCDEPQKKPRPLSLAQPTYTPQAIEARVEGKVRVELSLDEQGKVLSARVLSGLGHGLDERALDAAKRGSFAPATRCGKPVRATFVVGVRFAL
jgi:protein TonB